MNRIGFSHKYPKLHRQKTATLLAVRELLIPKDLNDDLLRYDTVFDDGSGKGYFPLPDGEYLQLIFIGNKHIPFCTIRSKWGVHKNKKEYYESKIGEEFEIHIKGE